MPSLADVRTFLLNQAGITAIVGDDGVFVDDAGLTDRGAYLVISQQGLNPNLMMQETTALEFVEIDIDCYAKTRPVSEQLARAVSDAIKDARTTVGTTTLHAVNWLGQSTDLIGSEDGSAIYYYVTTNTFILQWS